MPFSHIIPPSPSPSESKSPFYTSVSLLLSRIQGYHYHLSKFHIYVSVYADDTTLMAESEEELKSLLMKVKEDYHNPVCETAKETQVYRTDFWTLRERERVG